MAGITPRSARRSEAGASAFTSSRGASLLLTVCVVAFGIGFLLGALRSERDVANVSAGKSKAEMQDIAALSERVFAPAAQAATGSSSVALASAQSTKGMVCEDTCSKAKNGVCDDGSANQSGIRDVFCDLGTDCTDCGPWAGKPPFKHWPEGGPVAHLMAKDVPLFTRMTVTTPAFRVLYTDPHQDLDVSEGLNRTGSLESGITAIFRMVLEHRCIDPATGKRRLVVDVGANFGYFSIYAAKMGCRVVAWEPIPHFRAILEYGLLVNDVAHLVTVRDKVVSGVDNERITMQAPTKGVWGTASVSGINQYDHQEPTSFNVTSERVDSVVDEDVLLMKVDVEGFESVVFNSATRLLSQRVIDHIILEYNPGLAETVGLRHPAFMHLVEDNPHMLMRLLNKNYKIGMMLDHISKGGLFAPGTFPPLPEVTAARLKYDLEDAAVLRQLLADPRQTHPSAGLNCPIKPELLALNPEWGGCMRTPEDVHPKSLRSTFPYNTNLWAAREGNLLQVFGLAGAMGPDQDASKEWFIRAKEPEPFAMASRSCRYLPASMLVRNRCSCEWSVKQGHQPADVDKCRTEEKEVTRLFQAGRFKFTDYEAQSTAQQ